MNSQKDAIKLMHQIYNQLNPKKNNTSTNPQKILKEGYAWCLGYVLVFNHQLKKRKYKTRLISLVGIVNNQKQSHEVIEIKIDNLWYLFDPTTNKYFKYSLCKLLKNENLIDLELQKKYNLKKDKRWTERKYKSFCSTRFYKSVFLIGVRSNRFIPITWVLQKRENYEKYACKFW